MSEDKSRKACIRCIVQLSLLQLEWKDMSGVCVHLDGPPMFVRACVLGQLQHSHLRKPSFPLVLNQQFTFDRVFTNCRNPSLFNEVIRGEHVKIEVIQISPDYKSGKILARYECPAHEFLFPKEDSAGEDGARRLKFEHSRRYFSPPVLTYATSTVLLEATVMSPVRLCFPKNSEEEEEEDDLSVSSDSQGDETEWKELDISPPEERGKPGASRRLFSSTAERGKKVPYCPQTTQKYLDPSLSPQKRLHSLLEQYADSEVSKQKKKKKKEEGRSESQVYTAPRRVKFKPPVPRQNQQGLATPSPPSQSRRVTAGSCGRHHNWPDCPRRSPKQQRRSHPNNDTPPTSSPSHPHTPSSPFHQDCVPLPDEEEDLTADLESEELGTAARITPNLRPPFVVRHVDESLLRERNFCSALGRDEDDEVSHLQVDADPSPFKIPRSQKPQQREEPRAERHHCPRNVSLEEEVDLPSSILSPSKNSSGWNEEYSPLCFTPPPSPVSPTKRYHSPLRRHDKTKHELLSKYFTRDSPERRSVSPARYHGYRACSAEAIGEKLDKLRRECCECLHSAESLGEDDLSEDLERLQASLQGEREDALDRSSRFIPDQNVTVQLGPRDYWSKRMAEFTGKRHRVIFDETLEKIYNRLYRDASMAT